MVTTRSRAGGKASTAANQANTIAAARELRRQRRARTAEEEILGQSRPGPTKPTRRNRRPASAKTNDDPPAPAPAPFASQPPSASADNNDAIQTDHEEPQGEDKNMAIEPDLSQQAPPGSGTPADPQEVSPQAASPPPRQWFKNFAKVPAPNSAALNSNPPNFKNPNECLIHFAAGVPTSTPEDNPPETQASDESSSSGFGGNVGQNFAARKHEVIQKAATAVLAHMNGYDVERSDYVKILDGMLADPDMRDRLPPVLIEHYDAAVKGEVTTLYNGGLIERFIHATERAADVTAHIMMNTRNTRRERRAHAGRGQNFPAVRSSHPFDPQRPPAPAFDGSTEADPQAPPTPAFAFRNPFASFRDDLHESPMAAPQQSPPCPLLVPHPLTEANLNQCAREREAEHQARARNTPSLREEGRSGVVRTNKGSRRSTPYPRRDSTSTRGSHGMINPIAAHARGQHVNNECGISVYSASTGAPNLATVSQQITTTMVGEVKKMLDPESYEAQCVRTARRVLDDVERTHGTDIAARARMGFDLLHCYELVKTANVDLLSDALLEHVSETSHRFSGRALPAPAPPNTLIQAPPPPPATAVAAANIPRPSNEIPVPPPQTCVHPQLGAGTISWLRIFSSNNPGDHSFAHNPIILDSFATPPPP
ncbi:hypothetical protein PCASD_10126 [Puccinia coronata f. sp. avenae]|uniref:Uncharacterized protein n=1 Tax=Puccinia coronata f. sp. avenae TaxID=200324 RepID=A0A2N5UTY0_9BASI|nr:hypothetical protein PCASD_10126 [Puccinia coronata f. sp. avenae]